MFAESEQQISATASWIGAARSDHAGIRAYNIAVRGWRTEARHARRVAKHPVTHRSEIRRAFSTMRKPPERGIRGREVKRWFKHRLSPGDPRWDGLKKAVTACSVTGLTVYAVDAYSRHVSEKREMRDVRDGCLSAAAGSLVR